jgi:hypothetical protein
MAYRDAELYLYTDRRAAVPIAFSTEGAFTGDPRVLERDLAHITDAANALSACYWLTSQDDFEMDFPTAEARERVAQLMAGLPEVSRSQDGRIRLYDSSSLLQQATACATHRGGAN